MVEVKDLICSRQEHVLFSKVAFILQPGTALQIIGPNGIGKSSLLRILAGLLAPTFGKVIVNTKQICFIGHQHSLHPALTVAQNLQFLHALQTNKQLADIDSIISLLHFFRIPQLANKQCNTLSAGQLQRVALTVLCFTTAKLWLLDEPAAHLDTDTISSLTALCNEHLRQGGTLVCATHNLLGLDPQRSDLLELNAYA